MPRTLYDKIWDDHVVHSEDDGTAVLYIDRHLVHEVTSPQAFEGLELAGRKVWRVSANLAVSDHNVPTTDRSHGIADPISRLQVDTLDANCDRLGITQFKMNDRRQGIVHVIGPEQGATLPGTTVVCGDSHTSTHGAFGALAHGIGTSEVEHVLATQTLLARKAKNMLVRVDGTLGRGCSAKDIVLAVIGKIGTAGGTGYTIEFAGSAIRALSMEGRMTVCNMAIEAGARAGLIAVDETTIAYLRGRPYSPSGPGMGARRELLAHAPFRRRRALGRRRHARRVGSAARRSPGAPRPRWSSRSATASPIPRASAIRASATRWSARSATWRSSRTCRSPTSASTRCSSARARTRASKTCARRPRSCAGSARASRRTSSWRWSSRAPGLVKEQAEREGLDLVFKGAGFEWREPGCSMCLAMNADRLEPGERCASTSNRNFEGRQGAGGRTHLVSPAMAAAAAIEGHFVDVRRLA